ncbi:MAG: hypothetical protein EBZ51_07335 [Synechococcaceae bacterium WB9_2_112]|nr:hypothetical protein [Synechococcaceae bacterium WB9_2_112]
MAVDVGRALAQLSLLHAQLPKALAPSDLLLCKVAIQARSRLPKLGLLCGLLPDGRADVGKLTGSRLAKLCALGLELPKLCAALQAKLGLLHGGLSGLLPKRALGLSLLAVELSDAGQELRLLRCLRLLRLLQLRQLHSGLGVESSLLKALLRGLQAQLPLLASGLSLQLCGLGKLLRRRLAKTRLLCGNTGL